MLNLENLFKSGKALENIDYSNTDAEDKEERSTAESVTIKKDKTEDEKTVDESTAEIIKTKTDEEKEKDTEQDLEKKLKNIEKVIETFSGGDVQQLPASKDLVGTSSDNINIKPPDLSSIQAKANMQEYLKPSTRQDDRIALLYEDLRKYNLI
jgi:ABC-type sugar transport system ATPase subunit